METVLLVSVALPEFSADDTKEELLKDIPKEPARVTELRKEAGIENDALNARMIELSGWVTIKK